MPDCCICFKPVAADESYHIVNVSVNLNDNPQTFAYIHEACAPGQSTKILRERFKLQPSASE